MERFETGTPIALVLEIGGGEVSVEATERSDATVEVLPRDPGRRVDVAAARETTVGFANDTLTVESKWRALTGWTAKGAVVVRVAVPTDSSLRAHLGAVTLRGTGRLGACQLRSGAGGFELDETGVVEARIGAGNIRIESVAGRADIKTSSGSVRIGRIDGPAVVKNTNGETTIGEISGEARVASSNGGIAIERARAGVDAKTSRGELRIGEVSRGSVVAHTSLGAIEVGVAKDVPAYLDLETHFGSVRNELDDAAAPAPGQTSVEINARTAMGDIAIRRSTVSPVEATAV